VSDLIVSSRSAATRSSRLFDEIALGDSASYVRTLDVRDIDFVGRAREASIAVMALVAHSRREQLGLR
jgi:hypothetical protein